MTVVDVGANIGYYTWLASQRVGPSGRVVAIEPGPYAFERIQRVTRENGVRTWNPTSSRWATVSPEAHSTCPAST